VQRSSSKAIKSARVRHTKCCFTVTCIHLRTNVAQLSDVKKRTITSEWVSLKQAVDKYGMMELRARVASGSIEVRTNPHDARFCEFRVVSAKEDQIKEHRKSTSQTSTGKSDKEAFLALAKRSLSGDDIDFQMGEGEAETKPDELAMEFLGGKKGGKKGGKPPTPEAPAKSTATSSATIAGYLESLETQSVICDEAGNDEEIKASLNKAKGILSGIMGVLESDLPDKSKSQLKELKKHHQACSQMAKGKDFKKGLAKKVLNAAVKAANEADKFYNKEIMN